MPKFLMRGRYTAAGLAGAVSEGFASREQYVRQLTKLLDSEIDAVYWGVGDDHFFIVLDAPDAVTAASRTLATNVSGATSVTTTPIFTSEEMDAARSVMPEYRAPAA